jgi:Ca2+-binding RTX toxin-like protein
VHSTSGNDTLTGGWGSDTFIFSAAVDDVTVTDFRIGLDALRLDAALWSGAFDQAVLDSMSDTSSGNLVLTLASGSTALFSNLSDNTGLLDDIVLI